MKTAKTPQTRTIHAWGANAIAFIAERGLTSEFNDWCGGWPCPVSPQAVSAAPDLLEELHQQADGTSTIISLLRGQTGPVAASLVGMLRMQEQAARAAILKAERDGEARATPPAEPQGEE